jgi:uncharacterized protein (DUF362 family)
VIYVKNNEIHVIYGDKPVRMVKELLKNIHIENEIEKDMLIGIKPNLVVARPSYEGATTTPEIVEGVIQYLKEKGYKNIIILESSWVGDSTKRAFKVCGYEEISKKYDVPLYDLKEDKYETRKVGDLDLKICKKALEVDYLISMPVLKAHCQTRFTCALKNLKGCIPDSEKRRFHSLGLEKPIGHLGKALKCGLIIVDAINGDLTFEEGGNPVHMDRIIAGKDPVLIDTYGASLIGYSAGDIEYIGIAEKMGAGLSDLNNAAITEYNAGLKNAGSFKPSQKAEKLSEKVAAKDACSACYGGLIHALQRLDEDGKFRQLKDKNSYRPGIQGRIQRRHRCGQLYNEIYQECKGVPAFCKGYTGIFRG